MDSCSSPYAIPENAVVPIFFSSFSRNKEQVNAQPLTRDVPINLQFLILGYSTC